MWRYLALVLVVLLAGAGCGPKAAATPTSAGAPAATSTPRAAPTPTKAPAAGGMPFAEVKPKVGDWAKYKMPMGTMTQRAVEFNFGGTAYEGMESVMELVELPGMPAIPAIPGQPGIPGLPSGPSVSLFLTERGKPAGKSLTASKMGPQVQCSRVEGEPTPAPGQPLEVMQGTPDMTLLGTDTYKVPETGQTVKVWKYHMKTTAGGQTMESETWVSNEVPFMMVKQQAAGGPATTELLGFGSGAPLSFTQAELEANCR